MFVRKNGIYSEISQEDDNNRPPYVQLVFQKGLKR